MAVKPTSFSLSAPGFSLADTLDCGQSFRWEADGAFYRGIAGNQPLTVRQEGETLLLYGITEDALPFWQNYFDLDGEYPAWKKLYQADPVLKTACEFAGGITILRQNPWEALCSFILSQNNNIPRIKGIVKRLCEQFGESLGESRYGFPSPERIASCDLDGLSGLRAGFRAKYILDAARKVASGQLELNKAASLPYEEAKAELMQIMGVGPKVADCALLYGFHRLEAFPVDTWIKRVMERYYPAGLPSFALESAGVAQQYLFHSIRCGMLEGPEKKSG